MLPVAIVSGVSPVSWAEGATATQLREEQGHARDIREELVSGYPLLQVVPVEGNRWIVGVIFFLHCLCHPQCDQG